MASRPKRRRKYNPTASGPPAQGPNPDVQSIVQQCLDAILPTLRTTISNLVDSAASNASAGTSDQGPQESSNTNPSHQLLPTTLEHITGGQETQPVSGTPLQTPNPGIARPVGLGVDPKIKAKIWADEFVKFTSLLPKRTSETDEKFKQVEKDGQLVFVKSNEQNQIKSISKWLEAFHVFVAIYCVQNPSEVANLMTYAQIIQGTSKGCRDEAALEYDEKFREWRQVSSLACPWNQKKC